MSTSYPLSRLMTAATSAYAAYAIARPRHLARALGASGGEESLALDRLAYTYGVRDLTTSALLLSSRPALVRAGMALRITGDLGDCAILTATAQDPGVRKKVAGVTLGWASLNALAWWLDERRD